MAQVPQNKVWLQPLHNSSKLLSRAVDAPQNESGLQPLRHSTRGRNPALEGDMRRLIAYLDPLILGMILGMIFVAIVHA